MVTGGSGYIGSFVCRALDAAGHQVLVVDNLTRGNREAVDVPIEVGDVGDRTFLNRVFRLFAPDAVMHLAAWIDVGESVANPAKYFSNNVGATFALLEAMAAHRTPWLIFSSTAAVYGTSSSTPISESSLPAPQSPYGLSKLLTELALPSYSCAYGMKTVSLRYFNAAGAALDGSAGPDHESATHLITRAIQAALGKSKLVLFGGDYPTADGTCIRDYIHVLDIASAHLLALEHLRGGGAGGTYNIGTGTGHSNLEVIASVERASGTPIEPTIGPRRPGDPVATVADAERARTELRWDAKYSDLDTIVTSAWRWHSTHPRGYGSGLCSR